MMQQYLQTKEEYKDCILFYRLGDFYEMFFEDAKTGFQGTGTDADRKKLRPGGARTDVRRPVSCGGGILKQTGSKGHKVAICEQVEDPKLAKGLVKREVIRIVTPGTNLNMQALDEIQEQLYYVHRISEQTATAYPLRTSQPEIIYVTEVDSERKSFWMRS